MRSIFCLTMLMVMGAGTLDAQCRGSRCHGDGWGFLGARGAPAEFGVRGGYDFSDDVGLAGAHFRLPLVRQLYIVPSADVFFDDSPTEWQLNGDLMVAPDEFGGFYIGTGVALVDRDFEPLAAGNETEVGYNLLVGLDARNVFDTRVVPFAEARWTRVEDYDPFRLMLGINVPIR